jgi:hypothetical protein
MTTKVDEIIGQIPLLKVNLSDVFNFEGKCIDPLAIEIIGESLDYALETSIRRLDSVAKINPSIQKAAIENILPAVKTLRNLISNAPECKTGTLGMAPIKPETTVKRKRPPAKKDVVEKLTAAVTKEKSKKPAETIMLGKQFTLTAGEGKDKYIKKYLIVDPKIETRSEQVPEESDVIKLGANKELAKSVMGKKAGDDVIIEEAGGAANIKLHIAEVKEGRIKAIGE